MFRRTRSTIYTLTLWLYCSSSSWAQKALSINPDGIDLDSDDPAELGRQILTYAVNFVLIVLGVLFLVIWMKELIKNFSDARDDGKWGKVAVTAVGGLVLLILLSWISTFTTDLLS